MGFDAENSKKALTIHNNNVQEALEWLIAHQEELSSNPAPAEPAIPATPAGPTLKLSSKPEESPAAVTATKSAASDVHASLKCDDCGALLKDEDFATLHAHKTGHVNFSQSNEAIKPKSKEEIEEQKKRLAEKLVKLRAERAEQEKKDAIERELARRKEGRQIHEIKQKYQEDEMKRLADQKRREKLEDAAHKQRVKEGIAADRLAQKLAREAEAARAAGQAPPAQPAPKPTMAQNVQKQNYDECRIQIRLTDGKTMVEKFKATEQLFAVRLWVEQNRTDTAGPFTLMTTFPRKVYNEDDMGMTLKDLGLVPASSLVVQKL